MDAEAINNHLHHVADGELRGIVGVSEDELVSTDVIGSEPSALASLPDTMVVGRHTAKVLPWHDNEWGYARRLTDLVGWIRSVG